MSIASTILNLHPDPVPGYKFQVFINNIRFGFSKVTNIETAVETEPLQVGGVNDRVYSLRTPVKAERTLVLERGVASRGIAFTLITLRLDVGQRIPNDIYIFISNRNGVVTNLYSVHGAVVKKIRLSDLNAMSSDVLIESFEMTYETMESCPITAGILGGAMSVLGISPF